jgi:indole-3-glycerol phosphate synthase
LAPELPKGVVCVAESAISAAADVQRVGEAGFGAILVGTALVTADDPQKALEELVQAGQAVEPANVRGVEDVAADIDLDGAILL